MKINRRLHQNAGFSLIEVLVGLSLMGLILGIFIPQTFSSRNSLEDLADDLERMVRYSMDESTLKNAIMRIHFKLEDVPQEFLLEFGPTDAFVLPEDYMMDTNKMGLREKKKYNKKMKGVHNKFHKLKDLEEAHKKLEGDLKIIGITTSDLDYLATDSVGYIHIYPTGEKDNALIIIASSEEIISINIDPYTYNFDRTYHTIDIENSDEDQLEEKQYSIAKEIYDSWIKK